LKEWQSAGVSVGACASHRPTAHGSPLSTQYRPLPSLRAYVPLAQPVHAFLYPETRGTPAQHHYAYQTMHPAQFGEHHTYLDVAFDLHPQPTAQLQGTELRPRVIHYADDTVLLFPQLPFLVCLLFFDALSHHVHVFLFLFVSVNFEVEMASHDETATPDQPVGGCFSFERLSQLSAPIFPTHTKVSYIVGCTCLSRP